MNVPFMVVHGLHYILGPRESNQPLLAYNIHVWRARNRIAFQPNHFFFLTEKKKKRRRRGNISRQKTNFKGGGGSDVHTLIDGKKEKKEERCEEGRGLGDVVIIPC